MTDTLPASPPKQQVMVYSPRLDSMRRYLTDNCTPQRLAAIFKNLDAGDISAIIQLQEEMEGKDAHIQSVASTRRGCISGLDWEIEPAFTETDQNRADDIASYCSEQLTTLCDFDGILGHLNLGIGPNFACAEMIWENRELVDIVPVLGDRLVRHNYLGDDIKVITDQFPMGIDMPPGKFILYRPDAMNVRSMRVSLTRATAILWLLKNFSVTSWGIFVELYGQPFRTAKYTPQDPTISSADDRERTELRNMLKNLGTDGWGIFSGNVEIEWLSHTVTEGPQEKLVEWCDKKITILWKGATLTTDVGDTGAYSASKTHEAVEKRVMVADMKAESKCLRNQLLRPMVVYKFGPDAPVPYFKRIIEDQIDVAEGELKLKRLEYADLHNIDIDEDDKYDAIGFQKPKRKLKPVDGPKAITFNELTLGVERAVSAGDLELANAIREEISQFLSTTLAPLKELPTTTAPATNAQGGQGGDDSGNNNPASPPADDDDNDNVAATIRGSVLRIVARQFHTIDEIVPMTTFTRDQVRGVLQSPEVQPILAKKRKGHALAYRVKSSILSALT